MTNPWTALVALHIWLAAACLGLLAGGRALAGGSVAADPPPADPPGKCAPESKTITVTTRREGAVTHFYVENQEYCEVTMTFEMALENLKGDVAFPYTAVFPARAVTEAFSLAPSEAGRDWDYSYTNYYKLGSNRARPDDAYEYLLPYLPGAQFEVTQGYNGKFSHTGSNQYAIDWQMPDGTVVCAARGGVVVRVKDDSDQGGPSLAYDQYNNYVLIRHSDGTLGHYCHLRKGGCLVRPGQTVVAGEPIAHSGDTGFSSGPHLHFCVFKTRNGHERVSVPVKFRTATGDAITLVSGRNYRASGNQAASTSRRRSSGVTAQGAALQ